MVKGNITQENVGNEDKRIKVTGDVHLILADKAVLRANPGIEVSEGSSLTIYGQTKDVTTNTGKIIAGVQGNTNRAGIGGNTGKACGTIKITGGDIRSETYGDGASIGGGKDGSGGTITITGGVVTAKNKSRGAAIGGGENGDGGTITISGGEVNASGNDGAGIGGGRNGNGGTITINGGEVNASGNDGAGIGAGINFALINTTGGTITINGGTVTANSRSGGAGIGGGVRVPGGNITINGGVVNASAEDKENPNFYVKGAAIGGGEFADGGTITITGGVVNASANGYGAAIGGGAGGRSNVKAGNGGTVTITGGVVNATSKKADGIGGGKDTDGESSRDGEAGSFDTGTDGKAIIRTNSIADKTKQNSWNGIVFEKEKGTVYGKQKLEEDLRVEQGQTLTVPSGSELTIPEGKTLTIEGKLENNGSLKNNGKIKKPEGGEMSGSGEMTGSGKLVDPYPIPNAGIDYPAEKLAGLTSGVSYQITPAGGSAEEAMAAADGTIAIKADWLGKTLSLTAKEDDNHLGSKPQSLNIPARSAAPTGLQGVDETAFDKKDGKITGTTTEMQYQLSAASDWTACAGDTVSGLAPGTYLVRRTAVVGSAFASEAAEVRIKKAYRIHLQTQGKGTAAANPQSAAQGTEITLTAKAENGYYFKAWQAVSPSTLPIAGNQFTMPDSEVTITAIFELVTGIPYTPPTAKTNLSYTGNEQELIDAGMVKPSIGELKYSLSEAGEYKTEIPKGQDAGSYEVYYKVVGTNIAYDYTKAKGKVEITIAKANQAALAITEVSGKKFGDSEFSLTTTGGSGDGAVTYSVPEDSKVLFITGDTAQIIEAGEVVVTAVKAESKNYKAAKAERKITIAKAAAPALTFPTAGNITYGQKLSESTLTGGSTSYGTFAWADGSMIPTVDNTGYEVVFTPNEKTEKNYEAIAESNRKQNVFVPVAKATPTIHFAANILEKTGTKAAVLVVEMTGEGGADKPTGNVKFSYADAGTMVEIHTEALADGSVSYQWENIGEREYEIRAEYAGDSNYHAAESKAAVDTRKKSQRELVFADISGKTYGDEAFALKITGGDGTGALTYSVPAGNGVLEIEGDTAKIIGAGTVTITAAKAADADYNEVRKSIRLSVAKKPLTIKAEDKNILTGSAMPELTYNKEAADKALAKGDTFANPSLAADVANTNTIGEYDITISGGTLTNVAGEDVKKHYEITYQKGKLTIAKELYEVTVEDGTGSGKYSAGQTVRIKAKDKPWYTFTAWTSPDGVVFQNASAKETSFVMPKKAVTVTAVYKADDISESYPSSSSSSSSASPSAPAPESKGKVRNEAAKAFLQKITDPEQIKYVDRLFDPVPVIEKKAAIKGLTEDTKTKLAEVFLPKYTDVETGKWYSNDLAVVGILGLVKGTSASTITPAKNVSGKELMTILVRSMSKKKELTGGAEAASDWYAPYAKEAALLKLSAGLTFDMAKDLTRAEAAQMMYQYVKLSEKMPVKVDAAVLAKVKDAADIPAEYQEAAAYMYQIGIFKGYEDGSFMPNQKISRVEIIALIARLLQG